MITPNGWGGMNADEANRSMVSKITSFLINLDEANICKEEEGPVTPITIQLPIDQLRIEKEETQPVIITLPPKEKFDTKCISWDYSTKEVDAITQSGRCNIPKESEHEKKGVTKEDVKQLLLVMKTSKIEVIE